MANSPLFSGRPRKRTEVFDDLARPAHLFTALVASGCWSCSSQVTSKSSTSRGHDSLGHTPNLNKRNFCCHVRGTPSMEASICCKFYLRDSQLSCCSCRTKLAFQGNSSIVLHCRKDFPSNGETWANSPPIGYLNCHRTAFGHLCLQ